VAQSLRRQGLRAKGARKYKATTNSNHNLPVALNLLQQDFSAERANQKWVSDITYIATEEGWLYLAVVVDLYSRIVVGWSMSERMTLLCLSGLIQRAYAAGQNGEQINTIDVTLQDGSARSVGIYVNDGDDLRFFRPGHRADIVYALDELKQAAPDGRPAYSPVALEWLCRWSQSGLRKAQPVVLQEKALVHAPSCRISLADELSERVS
jgi:hypothetical protein